MSKIIRSPKCWLGAIFALFGVCVLYVSVQQSIWLDEGLTIQIAENSLRSINNVTMQIDFHPPLYYYLIHTASFINKSIVFYRMWSMLFYILSGVVLLYYLKSKKEFDGWGRTIGLFMFASAPFAVYYASELRSYMLVVLLGLCRFVLFDAIFSDERKQKMYLVGYVLASVVSIYVFYLFIISMMGEFLYVLLCKRSYFKQFMVAWLAIAVLYAPWMYLVILHRLGESPSHFLPIPWWQIPAVIFAGFSGGRIAVTDLNHLHLYWLTAIICVVYLINIIGCIRWLQYRREQPNESVDRVFFVMVAVVLLCVGFSAFKFSIFDPRYYSNIFPLFILALIYGNWYIKKASKNMWLFAAIALAVVNIVCLGLYIFNPWFAREPWKTVVPELESQLEPTDAIVFIGTQQPPPTYTAYQKKSADIISTYPDASIKPNDLQAVAAYLNSQLQDNKRVWYSQFLEWQKDPNHEIRNMVEKKYTYIKTIGFFKVKFDLYERK